MKHKATNQERSLVSTEEARRITSQPLFCDPGEWQRAEPKKSEGQSRVFRFENLVTDSDEVGIQGLWQKGFRVRGSRVKDERLTLTLSHTDADSRQEKRVAQLDLSIPQKPFHKNDKNWPHMHFGEEREACRWMEGEKRIDLAKAASFYKERTNVTFKPELEEPDTLKLR